MQPLSWENTAFHLFVFLGAFYVFSGIYEWLLKKLLGKENPFITNVLALLTIVLSPRQSSNWKLDWVLAGILLLFSLIPLIVKKNNSSQNSWAYYLSVFNILEFLLWGLVFIGTLVSVLQGHYKNIIILIVLMIVLGWAIYSERKTARFQKSRVQMLKEGKEIPVNEDLCYFRNKDKDKRPKPWWFFLYKLGWLNLIFWNIVVFSIWLISLYKHEFIAMSTSGLVLVFINYLIIGDAIKRKRDYDNDYK